VFIMASGLSLELLSCITQWVAGSLSLGIKQPGREHEKAILYISYVE
jgi:hypothetical protein